MAATIDEHLDALSENRDYSSSNSLSKARAYEEALLEYMLVLPSSQSDQGSSLAYDMTMLQSLLSRVTAFINAYQSVAATSSANSSVRFLSISEGFR